VFFIGSVFVLMSLDRYICVSIAGIYNRKQVLFYSLTVFSLGVL
jgi:hypothetical protein